MDKTILVTGANGAIGLAICRLFLEKQPESRVWMGIHRSRSSAEELASAFPERARLVDLDVADRQSWDHALQTIGEAGPAVEVLVNNAGYQKDGLLATMPIEDWKEVISTNLDGTFHGCQAVIRDMIGNRWGRIINVASLSAVFQPPGQANYAAAKAGVVAMSSSLAKEVARLGITVNSVCPGYIDTAALDKMSEEARKAARLQVPMRRFGQPEEVASTVQFLASEGAGYVTGSVLRVDGGIA